MPTETDWAYAAGLLDGDGCVVIAKQRKSVKRLFYYRVSVRITQNEYGLHVLKWLKDTFGGHICVCNKQLPKYKIPTYNWFVRDSYTESFLVGVYPYLLLKKTQANLALEFQKQKVNRKSSRRVKNAVLIQAEEILHNTLKNINQHKVMF